MPKWVLPANALPAGPCRSIDTQRWKKVGGEGSDNKAHAFDQNGNSGRISHLLALRVSIDFSSFTVAKHASFIHLAFVFLGNR